MIYIIGGSPRGGKTTLAKMISSEKNIPYLSSDYFRLMMIPYYTDEKLNKFFPFEKMYNDTGITKLYEKYGAQELLDADIKESLTLWTGLETFISFLSITNQSYILEGVHFLPHLLSKYNNSPDMKIIYLTKTDSQKIYEGLEENRGKGDWIADNIAPGPTLEKVANSLVTYGDYFRIESKKYGFKHIQTDEDFFRKLDFAYHSLIN